MLIFAVQVASPSVTIGDSRLSAITAWRLLTHGDLHLESYRVVTALADRYDLVAHDGHLLPYFPWPTMLFVLPAVLLLAATGHDPAMLSIADPARTFLVEVPTAAAVVTVTALLVRATVRTVEGVGRRSALPTLAALVWAFSTSAWSIGSRALWQQTVSMMVLALAVLAARRLGTGRRWPWVLGVALAAAPLVRPTDAVFSLLVGIWLVVRHREVLVRVALPAAAALAVFLAVSAWQYGTPVPPYYLPSRLAGSAPIGFADGLALNLVSPSRGLAVYDPVLLLAVAGVALRWRRRRLDALDAVLVAAVAAQLLVIAQFGSTGGHVFGPRLMIDVLPLLVVLAAPALAVLTRDGRPERSHTTRRRLAVAGVVAVLAAGLAVNATGALLRSSRCWNLEPMDVDARPSRIWDWADPQFAWPYRQLADGGTVGDVLAPHCDRPASTTG
ncbi:hypothetical protein [Nakamurella endophytica]|uniref:Uncharacterized protein n=1 Tax=Nakamurella endophytica TaxID=1748367 RepID=A0A917TAY3_9ACTN|nr:hypothetical protein [Nakamurella endophytica]GGM15577.1 hypothetical protein GCM10011594_39520 [Nakamurella endophytica]